MHTATTSTPIRTGLEPHEDDDDDQEETSDIESGTIDVFKWLGLKRFFPKGDLAPDPVVRGGASVGLFCSGVI
jgi:hypothetical protein